MPLQQPFRTSRLPPLEASLTMRPFSFVTLVIAFLLFFPCGVYSRPSAERPATQRYTLAPAVYDRLLRAATITPHVGPAIDLRPYFESQGVVFDRGCIANLNPSTGVLTI